MAKKKNIKKVVVTRKEKIKPTSSRMKSSAKSKESVDLVFGKKNYGLMLTGALLIFIGFLLMSGGHMPSDDVWDDGLIYSFRRVTLAPIAIIAGLIVEVVAIFRN